MFSNSKVHAIIKIFTVGGSWMEDVFFLRPVFKQCVWGGERLKTVFAYNIPGSQTGECWGVSVHANGD